MSVTEQTHSLPILPMKNTALFPHLLMPLSVGRPRSLAAVEAALATEGKELVLIAQRDASVESPEQSDLFTYGTKAVIRRMQRPSETHVELLVQGVDRVMLVKFDQTEPYLAGSFLAAPVADEMTPEVEALQRSVLEKASRAIELAEVQVPIELSQLMAGHKDPVRLVYLLASMFSLDLQKEQTLLEAQSAADALRLLHNYLTHEVQVLELRHKINESARSEMSKEQREYMLRQQLRAIQDELGEKTPEQSEVDLLKERLEKVELPDEVRKEADRELRRLERLPSAAPDFHVIRTYLEYVIELPWRVSTEDILDIGRARQVLDEDHFDLADVKSRILEHLAVLKMNPGAKAPILCFVGPPERARPRSANPSPAPSAGSSNGSASAVCTTRRNCADTAAPTSAPCPAGSCRQSAAPAPTTR
jgi:ATP-dependent Lon protease